MKFQMDDYVVITVPEDGDASFGDVEGQYGAVTQIVGMNDISSVRVRAFDGLLLGSLYYIYKVREIRHAEPHEIMASKFSSLYRAE